MVTVRSWRRIGTRAKSAVATGIILALTLLGSAQPARSGVPEGEGALEALAEEEPRPLTEERAALQAEIPSAMRRLPPEDQAPAILHRVEATWSLARGDSVSAGEFARRARARAASAAALASEFGGQSALSLRHHLAFAATGRWPKLRGARIPTPRVIEELAGYDLRDGRLGYWVETVIGSYTAVSDGQGPGIFLAARLGAAALKRQALDGLSAWKTPYADGTGWAALSLVRWGALAHDDSAIAIARALIERMQLLKPAENPTRTTLEARAAAALAVELLEHPAPMAYVIGNRGSKRLAAFHRAAFQTLRPERLISLHDRTEPDLLYPPQDGKTVVYVCSGQACAAPVTTAQEMVELLETFARPELTPPPAPEGAASPR